MQVIDVQTEIADDVLSQLHWAQTVATGPEWANWLEAARENCNRFVLRDGLVCRSQGDGAWSIAVLADDALRQKSIKMDHDSPLGGHFGMYCTMSALHLKYW